jgi:hypothetical protein
MVELLTMAHERACEAELAHLLEEDLAIRRIHAWRHYGHASAPIPPLYPKS